MNLGHWILTVISHFDRDLVKLVVAFFAKPHEKVFLAGFAFALEDDEP